ncbi:MAG TPA: GDSL-type esterase/lipase family protein [Deltaproteobacteria bacterium]|jgi:lysophospholipase L1-like esterase|nr:GDSL-type esterase/lipase family protein [Deltaproteobacteria bacterium]HQJ07850.1 GDSL-type esterase/lipase family protein [Deltaproteobacteria bacterium]
MKRLPAILFIAVCTALVASSLFLSVRIYKAVKLAESSKAFSIHPKNATKRVLIAGDSIGVGTGASDPSRSLAGRIFRDFPFTRIENVSEDGARAPDILNQILSAGDGPFDVILIAAGEDDVLFLTDPDTLKSSLLQALHLASRKAPCVILLGTENIGLKPALFPPIDWFYTSRARKIRDMLILISRETGTEYADPFREKGAEPFSENPKRYYADDLLHPGSEGYAFRYEDLKKQTAFVETMNAR